MHSIYESVFYLERLLFLFYVFKYTSHVCVHGVGPEVKHLLICVFYLKTDGKLLQYSW